MKRDASELVPGRMQTLKKSLGAEFSYDLWQAWVDALCTLSRVLTAIAAATPARTTPVAA